MQVDVTDGVYQSHVHLIHLSGYQLYSYSGYLYCI
jgi:hypothetical protein